MLGENGFCDNGPHTAGSKGSHQRGDGMDEEDDEIAHPLSYQFPNSNSFNVLGISPGTRLEPSKFDNGTWGMVLISWTSRYLQRWCQESSRSISLSRPEAAHGGRSHKVRI